MNQSIKTKKVAVIGGGPTGLVTIKELVAQGHEVVAFEKQSGLGGVYSATYDKICLTTNSVNVSFSDYYKNDVDKPTMWTREKYIEYLAGYADKFDLLKYIHFAHEVVNLKKDKETGKWRLVARDLKNSGAELKQDDFDAIAICTGVNAKPNKPYWPGLETFSGRVLHTVDYYRAEAFKGKNVLIVGLGESASDISLQIAQEASTCCISSRKGPGYVIPRYFGGMVTDLDTNRVYHSLPRWIAGTKAIKLKLFLEDFYRNKDDDNDVLAFANRINKDVGLSAFNRYGTKNTSFVKAVIHHNTLYKPNILSVEPEKVIFVDGSEFVCDTILLCTGFKHDFPFLEEEHKAFAYCATNSRKMYKNMIIPTIGKEVVFIGFVRPGIGSIPPCGEMQARYFALLMSGIKKLPGIKEMLCDIKKTDRLDHEQYPLDAKHITSLTDYFRFMSSMSRLIGCRPKLLKLFFTKPRIWGKVMFAPITGAQFRLHGTGADPKSAEKILKRIPTMPKLITIYEFFLYCFCKLMAAIGCKGFRTID